MLPETFVALICTFDQSGSCCAPAALPQSSPANKIAPPNSILRLTPTPRCIFPSLSTAPRIVPSRFRSVFRLNQFGHRAIRELLLQHHSRPLGVGEHLIDFRASCFLRPRD